MWEMAKAEENKLMMEDGVGETYIKETSTAKLSFSLVCHHREL